VRAVVQVLLCTPDLTLTAFCAAELVARRAEVVSTLKELQGAAEKVVAFLTNPALVKTLRNDKAYNLEMLKNEHQARDKRTASPPGHCLGLFRPAAAAAH
jgi:hypothetical protein